MSSTDLSPEEAELYEEFWSKPKFEREPSREPGAYRRILGYCALLTATTLIASTVAGVIEHKISEPETVEQTDDPVDILPPKFQDIYNSTAKIIVEFSEENGDGFLGLCSGNLVNGKLLTAKHCFETEEGEAIEKVGVYKNGTGSDDMIAEGMAWTEDPKNDIAVVEIGATGGALFDYRIESPADVPAPTEDLFYIDGLPGESIDPTISVLTYAGRFGGEDYFLREKNDPDVCEPGASGSLMSNGVQHSILVGSASKEDLSPHTWQGKIDALENLGNSAIVESDLVEICVGEPIGQDTLARLYEPLDPIG